MRGIYKITSKINNKVYIGESLDIRRRWEEHIEDLNKNEHHSYKLQEDWNEYGKDNFEFYQISVLDDSINSFVDKYICLIFEYKYIQLYDSLNNGYNIECSLKEVLNKNKTVMNPEKDSFILKTYCEKVKSNIIKEIGGIIYIDSYSINDVREILCLENKTKLKALMYNAGFLSVLENDKYILNETLFDKEDMIANDNFSGIKINKALYLKLIDELKLIIDGGKANYYMPKVKKSNKESVPNKNNNIKQTIKNTDYSQIKVIDLTLTSFLSNFTTTMNPNDVFKFLREYGVLKYIWVNEVQRNYIFLKKEKKYYIIYW